MSYYERLYAGYVADEDSLDADIAKACRIDMDKIDEECRDHASVYVRWGILVSVAETKYREHKDHTNQLIWPQAMSWSRETTPNYGVKPTETQIKENAYREETYQQALGTLRKLGDVLDKLKKVESALWKKTTMLETLRHRQAREFGSTPREHSALHQWTNDPKTFIPTNGAGTKKSIEELEEAALKAMEKSNVAG